MKAFVANWISHIPEIFSSHWNRIESGESCGKYFIGAKSKLDKLYALISSAEYKGSFSRELSVCSI